MRILVAVDGSDPSRRAAVRAAELARRLGEGLTVVHVLSPPPIFSEPAVLPDVRELERRDYERAKAVMDERSVSLRRVRLEVQTQLLARPALPELADASQFPEWDLLGVGNAGR